MWVLELSVHINDVDVLRDTSQTKSVHKLKFSKRFRALAGANPFKNQKRNHKLNTLLQ